MRVFNKPNNSRHSDALMIEARGLELIRSVLLQQGITEISIPMVIESCSQSMSLTLIEQQQASARQMRLLGIGLAKLHLLCFDSYGLDYDNYIGLNHQKNAVTENWGQFFFDQRLSFQIQQIRDHQLQRRFQKILENCEQRLVEFLNASCKQSSLVHGDLWSGNVLFDAQRVWLIDPAVYYADREVDIAMTELFGGFNSCFYESYQEIYPLSIEYSVKKEIYNLYHFLNHYNLFGSSYLQACEERMSILESL